MRLSPSRFAGPVALGLALGYGGLLALFLVTGRWILDANGHPLIADFLSFYTGGKQALHGQMARAYDWRHLHAVEVELVGHDFAGFLGWAYPPIFFLVVMALAALPYAAAFLAWIGATAGAFAAVLARIANRGEAASMGLAMPPALACAISGQNGFFTAALFGAFLLALPRRPVLAGLLIALLAYKPQFGILIPVALLAGGHWRAFFSAAAFLGGWVFAAWLAAPAALSAFFSGLPGMGATFLTQGFSGWFKLQSVYAVSRFVGLSDWVGWALQITVTLAMVISVAFAWSRRHAVYDVKAAALAAATLLATPYIYFYDLPLLAVPLAFLWRAHPFDRMEKTAIAAMMFSLAAFAFVAFPVGLPASMLAVALVVRRCRRPRTRLPVLP